MPFSEVGISDLRVCCDGPELHVAWTTNAPWGTCFQVYLDRRLVWCGRQHFCNVPCPADASGRNLWVEVGTVSPAELAQNFSGLLVGPGGSGERARLSWYGGTYLDQSGQDDIQGFFVFRSPAPGAQVDFTSPIDLVSAYPCRIITDGFGMGEYGLGGFGRAASFYEWQSRALTSGVWEFAVAPYDKAGNVRAGVQIAAVTINAPPRPPAANSDNTRLTYSYSGPATRLASLNWLASPS